MSLIEELRAKSTNIESTKANIVSEIRNYFDKYLMSDKFEDYLRNRVGKEEALNRKLGINIEFWAFHSGCSATHFSCGGCTWYNPDKPDSWESHYYKGIELVTIHEEVCCHIASQLRKRMVELGFHLCDNENLKGKLNYYHMYFYFGW